MSAGSVSWPSSSATIASVGSNNSPIPASSDLAGAKDLSGNLQPLLVDGSGNLKVAGSFTPPALQNVNLTQVNGAAIVLGQALEAASLPVTIASDQSAIPISVSSLPLPTGGATSANQTTGNTSLSSIDTKTPALVSGRIPVDGSGVTQPVSGTVAVSNFPATQPVSGTVAATQSGTWTVNDKQATPTAGTITQASITVGTSAVRLTVSGSAPSSARQKLVAIPDPASTATFYIGSSSVTNSGATRGIPLQPGQPFEMDFDAADYYIISSTAAQTVFVMEVA